MHGRLATTQQVVIHAGEVVVNQRVGMQQLNGHCRRQRRLPLTANGLGCQQGENRTQPFSAHQHAIADRLVEAGRALPLRRQRLTQSGLSTSLARCKVGIASHTRSYLTV